MRSPYFGILPSAIGASHLFEPTIMQIELRCGN